MKLFKLYDSRDNLVAIVKDKNDAYVILDAELEKWLHIVEVELPDELAKIVWN